jgi:MFS transporter, DHA1 family, inner membrane transport protein
VLGAMSVPVLVMAIFVMPPLRGHLNQTSGPRVSTWQVFADTNHLRAFTLMGALVFTTFCIAPAMVHYLEYNVGVARESVKWIYVCGGAATVVTLSLIGRLADLFGKLPVFRILALTTIVPILMLTNLPSGASMPLILVATTLFMVLSSGRMVPAMALITASSTPAYRGSFMSLNAVVQHLATALASVVAGEILTQDADKALVGYPWVGLVGCVAALISLYLAGRLRPVAGGLAAPDSKNLPPTHSASPDLQGEKEPQESVAW